MFEDLIGAYGSRLVIAILGVGVGLVVLIGILLVIRRRNGPSPFVRGGKNRQPRLQVLDAAAVDTRRRLVLIRRDDVEHLIMIGGPTDIVIESGIGGPHASFQGVPARSGASSTVPISEPRQQPAIENRGIAQQRPAPVAAAESRLDPLPETAFMPEPPKPQRVIPVAPVVAPQTVAAPQRPAPVSPPVSSAPRVEPAAPPLPEVRPEPPRPIVTNAATIAQSSAAAAILDAARERVLQPAPAAIPEPRLISPVNTAAISPGLQPAADRPQQLGTDFEKILEEEMANNLAARDASLIEQPKRDLPPRDPSNPKVTGATPEPSLQSEVARIFGEMSVNRDN